MSSDHDEIAEKLARKFKTKHRQKGVDIITKGRAIEVAVTKDDVHQSVGQLKRSRAKKKYMSVPSPLISDAKKLLKGSGIGIMDTRGKIKKRSRKKKIEVGLPKEKASSDCKSGLARPTPFETGQSQLVPFAFKMFT